MLHVMNEIALIVLCSVHSEDIMKIKIIQEPQHFKDQSADTDYLIAGGN